VRGTEGQSQPLPLHQGGGPRGGAGKVGVGVRRAKGGVLCSEEGEQKRVASFQMYVQG
jgi:hypothetical protein